MPTHGTLNRSNASKYLLDEWLLRRGSGYLQQIASAGRDRQGNIGPAFRMAGRFPVYRTRDLDEYAKRVLGPLVNSNAEYRRVVRVSGGRA